MKNMIRLFIVLSFMTFAFSSCSDDFEGIKYNLKAPDSLVFAPGETATFELEVSDDTGISQLNIMEPSLGINRTESYTPAESEINYSFSTKIPEDQNIGSEITIDVEIVDVDNNMLIEQIKISIEQ